eukprot:scaffold10507_cov24-Prasinocladus_malaysianus.AAC.3
MELAAKFKYFKTTQALQILQNNLSAKKDDATKCCSHELGCHTDDGHIQPPSDRDNCEVFNLKQRETTTTGYDIWLEIVTECRRLKWVLNTHQPTHSSSAAVHTFLCARLKYGLPASTF